MGAVQRRELEKNWEPVERQGQPVARFDCCTMDHRTCPHRNMVATGQRWNTVSFGTTWPVWFQSQPLLRWGWRAVHPDHQVKGMSDCSFVAKLPMKKQQI